MKVFYRLSFAAIALTLGCGPAVDRGELGAIISKPPEFDPYEDKYPLPQLEEGKPATPPVRQASPDKPGL